ncbi:MAG: hypothetical protein OEY59_00600 [Deltaproteobacteria bacterium]|nr:hypothetical protein [Deltaproteobacteria bacterium]
MNRRFLVHSQLVFFFALIVLTTSCQPSPRPALTHGIKLPTGWFISHYNAQVDLLSANEKGKNYSIKFDRITNNKEESYFLSLAEAIFPMKNKILAEIRGSSVPKQKLDNWYFERLWWFDIYQGGFIPYAITGDAVNFYTQRYINFKKNLKETPSDLLWKKGNKDKVEFTYEAQVIIPQKRTDANLREVSESYPIRVIMSLKWYEFCGQPCGWGFEKKREILFSSKTEVIEIKGDGIFKKWVSTPESPYAPHQWITF